MTIAATVEEKLAALDAEHRRRWRQWAADIAAGRPAPNATDVLEVAAALSIPDPGAALESDAAALTRMAEIERAIASCEAADAEKLKPWGGSLESLLQAVADAAQEARRLAELHESVGMAGVFWLTARHHLRRENPRMFCQEANA